MLSSLPTLIGIGLHSLLDLTQILLSLNLLIFEGVPINEMSPEAFAIMEVVAFLEGNVITADLILFDVFDHISFGTFHVEVDNFEGRVSQEGS